ncbi:MAG TPA: DNA gyrase inhibitor YacG [Verrucomicrobiae bacterium]
MSDKPLPEVKCLTCKKRGAWFEGKFGPFCSSRCRLLDLGKWLDEENKISEPLKPEHFKGYEELPPGEYLDKPERNDQ